MNEDRAASAERDARRFVIRNVGSGQMVERFVLDAVRRGALPASDRDRLLRMLFGAKSLIERYACATAYVVLTGGRLPDAVYLGPNPREQEECRQFADWVRRSVVEGALQMPPLRGALQMAFFATVMDRAEAHLLSVRAHREADRVALTRGAIDVALQRAAGRWVLVSGYVSHIGHCVYAATLIEMIRRGRLERGTVEILPGPSHNPFLRRYFEPYMLAAMPDGLPYAEMVSPNKRHRASDGSWLTMSELVSEAVTAWSADAPFAVLDDATRARGDAALRDLGVPAGAEIVTLHVREPGFNEASASAMELRDARIADYRAAIGHLVGTGTWVIRLGDRSMTRTAPLDGFVDYPFTDAKSDWMDVYLAARCRFHIGTSSGMSFVPMLFGRPVLFTNWTTLAHMVCAPGVVVLPKVLLAADGGTVPIREYCGRHGRLFERTDADLFGLSFRDNTPDELADAVRLMDAHIAPSSGRAVFPAGLFATAQDVIAASPLRSRPQIPPAFWRQHYAGG